jgi:RNA polymerase sigma-70 factor, ECF subfamily
MKKGVDLYKMNFVDKALVTVYLQTQDETTFRLLYARHAQALWNMAMKLTAGNGSKAEEVVQDTWFRAITGLPSFEWRSSLRTWMIKILINRWREMNRKKSEVVLEEAHLQSDQNAIILNDTQRVVALLPEGYRTVLLLHDLEGYKHEEIARMLDIAPGTSKSQLYQARKAFRELIQKENT